MKYLLDTCLLSELIKPTPSTSVLEWVGEQDETGLFISVLTLGEIHKEIGKLPNGRKKLRLQAWIDHDLCARFKGRIIEIDAEVAETWGSISAKTEGKEKKLPAIDGLLAATALAKGLTVITRNTKDIGSSGAQTLNPWK
ncbi:type II toxin-antitoxin system VapC family toxin [Pontiella sulfatireligans]|uniref:Toxin FitB n=1 Tax=Pontiella sulfatireligans TaxID=2750658 RepID=A0A6C2UHS9_9BACT|nr:type II toxin-antitoxin system VapC family toxin [Pontiella sulfatireligans]VGO19423.1 Toxin FitB [Pontiella sulfatireligans]